MGAIMDNKNNDATLSDILSAMDKNALVLAEEKSKEYLKLMSYYRCAMMEIETKLNVLNEEFTFRFERNPICSIKTRLKSPPSIREKLLRRGLDFNMSSVEENLFDVAGVRVICSFVDDVYRIADALLSQDDVCLIAKKDYIKKPKDNGYRSLHLIVEIPIFLADAKRPMKVEIQLRTLAMDFWASLEHEITYKKELSGDETVTNELRELSLLSADLDYRMNLIRKNVLEED